MRRWMFIIALAAFVFALAAGWGIGRLAGGGDGEDEIVVRPLATLAPTTASVEPDPTSTPASTGGATPIAIDASPASSEAAPATASGDPP